MKNRASMLWRLCVSTVWATSAPPFAPVLSFPPLAASLVATDASSIRDTSVSPSSAGGAGMARRPVASARKFKKNDPARFPTSHRADPPISVRLEVVPGSSPMSISTSRYALRRGKISMTSPVTSPVSPILMPTEGSSTLCFATREISSRATKDTSGTLISTLRPIMSESTDAALSMPLARIPLSASSSLAL